MAVYVILAALAVALRNRLPRGWYVIVMTAAQLYLCGVRHPHLTGDLMKYHWLFLNGGEWTKNFGFDGWMQAVFALSNGNFQVFLFLTAAITQVAVGLVIFRYCPEPWLGFLAYQCLGFYIGGFSAVKQSLAMALVLLAYPGIEKGDVCRFLLLTCLAGLIHRPALIVLPAYPLTRLRFDRWTVLFYGLLGGAVWVFREQVTALAQNLYYGEAALTAGESAPGGRFFLMVLILTVGVAVRGTEDASVSRLCHLLALGAVVQLLGVFGNAFTRLADYYFQFAILFLPALIQPPQQACLPLDRDGRRLLAGAMAVCLLGFYWVAYLNVPILYETDNYLNYRFFWQTR